ncbi:hypothetical protein FC32_GL001176 [Ligilactobacillus apodemi DSM 16634 = JCM 16172]|uniref:UPF0398 protein FC32_GL001176 n=1 Tax=Ligilactobacillus apodemi DSM 16634 = JCM 16172 TaxID=1423724 RepID=A0A0R1TUL7_9LACO|nr:DUF1273 domain-containing protein [Ligilactobacillus apodemi]KRL83908.1 hypothetical protein FC32_GL001176 [Ligilactobacillus apodemi DSM 16634 = JCM 16172]
MRLWITGYRSYELGIFKNDDPKIDVLKYCLRKVFERKADEGLEWIISGGQLGIEQWALTEAVEFTKEFMGIKTALMYPYAEFSKNWQEEKQLKLLQLEQQVDFFANVSKTPYTSPAQLKNYQQFMLAHTDQAVMIYDPEYPGKTKYDYDIVKKYQEKHAYQLELVDMYQLQDEAQQYLENKHTMD